jgi:hypothetical protein
VAQDRLNTWTPGGTAIVHREHRCAPGRSRTRRWIMAGAKAARCAACGTGYRYAAVCRQASDRPRSDLHLSPAVVWRGMWDTTKVKDVSGRKESSPQHSSPAPETALLTFCTGTLGYFHPVYSLMLPNVGSTDRTWRLADGPRRLRFSFEGSRGVGRAKVARTGAVMSNPLLSRSSTP